MADINDIEFYLTDKNKYVSLMNRVDFLDYVTENDYTLFQINDKYQYRADMIAEDLLGNKNLYFFIIWFLYGIAALLNYKMKNIMYNILDLFAKNLFGIYLGYVILTNIE